MNEPNSAIEPVPAQQSAYQPGALLRNGHLQSILVSSPPRRWLVRRQTRDYQQHSQKEIVATPPGPRLLATRTLAKDHNNGIPAKARVIMLHGWEGCETSNYMLGLGNALWQQGFETIRLNFRDHGDSHYLNEGIFHSCRLQEVVDAVRILASDSDVPVFMTGFSLGGNFALRVACQAHTFKVVPQHVFAISPAIVPQHVLQSMDETIPVYSGYFSHRWRNSLRKKQALYPEQYNFTEWLKIKGLRNMTETLVHDHTDFDDVESYFDGYSVAGNYLSELQVPTSIITAQDDPIIPVSDFALLPDNPHLHTEVHDHGGHCGFITNWRLHSWLEHELPVRMLAQL